MGGFGFIRVVSCAWDDKGLSDAGNRTMNRHPLPDLPWALIRPRGS
jgi:hypothetical protein